MAGPITPGHIRVAQQTLQARWRRDAIFGADHNGFGEPAWDMLLLLFIEGEGDGAVAIAALYRAAGKGPEIAERYMKWLVVRGFVSIEGIRSA